MCGLWGRHVNICTRGEALQSAPQLRSIQTRCNTHNTREDTAKTSEPTVRYIYASIFNASTAFADTEYFPGYWSQSTDRTYIIYWRRSLSISAIFPSIQMLLRRPFTLRYMSLLASDTRLEASLTSDSDLSCSRLLLYLNRTQRIPPTATGTAGMQRRDWLSRRWRHTMLTKRKKKNPS